MFSKETKARLDEKLTAKCQEALVPGMALVISQRGEPVYENYYGYRNIAKKLPVTSDTIFGVASITKSLTALAVMQLRDAGKLRIEDKVLDWLPALKLPKADYAAKLEIRHLMSHTSGLPGMSLVHQARSSSILEDPDGEYLFGKVPRNPDKVIRNVYDLIEAIGNTDFTLLGPPGSVFNYSNEGFALLQAIIERASGTDFIDYIERNIFEPLGMKNAYFLTESITDKDNVTELYAYKKGKQDIFHSPAWWDVADIYTNGSLKCSPADLMKYIDVYRLNGIVDGQRIVSEKSIQEMTAPVAVLPTSGSYGYGIDINRFQQIDHFGHGGSIKGVSANFQVIKELDITASILINMAEVPAEAMLLSAIRTLLELPEKAETTVVNYPLSSEALRKFIGNYLSAEGHEAAVTMNDVGLTLHVESQATAIYPTSENDFLSATGDRYHFMMDGDKVTGIFIGKRIIPKVREA
ncbi:serine hydrolase domain-containing protein [Virgibacillus sp. 179-BFC.A HS]|uniref:Serine hydrolase domain-containing protein n=1 Tax=Tigheibacillus jepli TaxID=3035914 RepID=A0ABU5CEV1_9BACI|nr:serine hydrolase domain-containing protein [Virgibacillus sp. 179-BFC.A HS]MDY0404854.1 serine hydrolase domain-containing protein [Virgibacillus sp. 179-BFC.A HS]